MQLEEPGAKAGYQTQKQGIAHAFCTQYHQRGGQTMGSGMAWTHPYPYPYPI